MVIMETVDRSAVDLRRVVRRVDFNLRSFPEAINNSKERNLKTGYFF